MADRTPDNPELAVDEMKRKARRRLVGAVVLALAAAIILPLLLEKDPKPLGEDVSVKIPPIDDGRFVNKLSGKDPDVAPATAKAPPGSTVAPADPAPPKADVPVVAATEPQPVPTAGAAATAAPKKSVAEAEQRMLTPTPKAAPAPAAVAASTPAATPAAAVTTAKAPVVAPPLTPKAAAPAAAVTAPQPASKAEPRPAAAPVPAAAAPAREGFVVQLAAFADDKGANALAGKLKRAGYAAYVEPVETSRGRLWRVRVGGYGSRADADAGRARLKADGQNGIVVPAS